MRRIFTWIELVLATVVVVGVFLQAFFITAYARGAGEGAGDAHETVGFIVHLIEVLVLLAALVAWWRNWPRIGLAFALPAIGTLQLFAVGDAEQEGGWVNGFHGLLALVVLVLAAVIAHADLRALGLRPERATAS